jgi:predicted DNA-binding transcriptional regulator YafY
MPRPRKIAPAKLQRDILKAIRDSARSLRLLNISYVDAKGVASVRMVEPYELRENSLFAFCRKANNIRRFNLSQITQAQITDVPFIPKFPFMF